MLSKHWGAVEACSWQVSRVRHLSVRGAQQGTGADDVACVQIREHSVPCGAPINVWRTCVMGECLGDIEFVVARPNIFSPKGNQKSSD